MNTMTLTRPAERNGCRIRLTPGLAAPAEARRRIRAVLRAWQAPVDPDVAVLLTSDLVTDVIRHQAGVAVTLAACCGDEQLRVEVHGPGPLLPWPADSRKAPRPGVILVATLAAEWGRYRTPDGEAAYFTLPFESS